MSRAQVEGVVDRLMAFSNNMYPGLKLDWDRSIDVLECNCLSTHPDGTSICGDVPWYGDLPRMMDVLWFCDHILDQDASGGILLQDDNYTYDVCWCNLYFVGALQYEPGGHNQVIFGVNTPTAYPRAVVVTDGQPFFLTYQPPWPWPENLDYRRISEHEFACHFFQNLADHVGPQPPYAPGDFTVCSDPEAHNLCIDNELYSHCATRDYGTGYGPWHGQKQSNKLTPDQINAIGFYTGQDEECMDSGGGSGAG
jgi:hypothetical protein